MKNQSNLLDLRVKSSFLENSIVITHISQWASEAWLSLSFAASAASPPALPLHRPPTTTTPHPATLHTLLLGQNKSPSRSRHFRRVSLRHHTRRLPLALVSHRHGRRQNSPRCLKRHGASPARRGPSGPPNGRTLRSHGRYIETENL